MSMRRYGRDRHVPLMMRLLFSPRVELSSDFFYGRELRSFMRGSAALLHCSLRGDDGSWKWKVTIKDMR